MKTTARGAGFLILTLIFLGGWFAFSDHKRPAIVATTNNPTFASNSPATIPATTVLAPQMANSSQPVAPALPEDAATSNHPVERAVAAAKVLEVRREKIPGGGEKRTRLVKSAIHSNRLRVEEEWSVEAAGQTWTCRRRELFLADQLILKVRAGIPPAVLKTTLANLGMSLESAIAENVYTIRLREAEIDSVPRALAALAHLPEIIEHGEADGVGFGGGIPNDPNFTDQWGMHNVGQSGGTADADVDAPELWDILGTTPGMVVAVLDSGLNFTHPDLLAIATTNMLEIAADGLDNDGNGRIDDVNGWDFTNGDKDPTDDHGHGSNVSGILAANRNNGVGIAGMLGGVKILVCKILNASNAGTTSALIAATTYARLQGVPVMNLSLQNYPFSSTLNTEFNACQTAGILLCICAGNQGANNDVTPNYPSCYPQTNVVAVGNHDRTDVRWSGAFNPSNYGLKNVDLYAPGRDILSPVLGTAYSFYTGTSQATPFVTAVAAAIKYLNPDWKAAQIKSSILISVVSRPSYSGVCVAGGRLDAVRSVAQAIRQQPANDRDADQSPNLLEYLAGTQMDDATSQPAASHRLENGYLRLKLPRVTRPDAHLEIQTSVNLVDWSVAGVTDFSTTDLLEGGILVGPNALGFLRITGIVDP